ncbi:MarR family winged helix-turn-helix transcriptional regulator [Kineosporia sp. A_224]|uniref:MarR family winged helix-turn-helix transcriptional regulator n=1 Tax=Kineosporia sp. A_224 TaxID=1962180 RepID=UPI000B4ACE62|nr:MarR family transcriptional regulator [Kineosporia sp. A_224]
MAAEQVPEGQDVPWLDDAELHSWLALVRVLVRLPTALERRLQQVAGLTQFEYYVLSQLFDAPEGRARMTDLAASTRASTARLSHVAGRLEQRGLIERRARPDDRRSIDAIVTQAGRELVRAAAPEHVRQVRRLVVDALGPERLADLGSMCAVVLEAIDTDAALFSAPDAGTPGA